MLNEFLLENLKEEGKRLGVPLGKERALIREYLQTRIIYLLYNKPLSKRFSFIGGTSLRILRNLDRFSEDLDFDNLGLNFSQIKNLFSEIKSELSREGFEIDYKIKKTNGSGIGEFKFNNLLFQLKISSHKDEKLVIKINYTSPKIKPKTETVILNRFGFVQGILTNTPEFLLAGKMRAILTRKDLQPRDFYDVVWFLSKNIYPDIALFSGTKFKSEKDLFIKLQEVFEKKAKSNLPSLKNRLKPFLIQEKNIYYLDIFGDLIKKMAKQRLTKAI